MEAYCYIWDAPKFPSDLFQSQSQDNRQFNAEKGVGIL